MMADSTAPIAIFLRLQKCEARLKAVLLRLALTPPPEKKRLEALHALCYHLLYEAELFPAHQRPAQQSKYDRAALLERHALTGEYYNSFEEPTPFDIPRLLADSERLLADRRFRLPWLQRVTSQLLAVLFPAKADPTSAGFLGDYIDQQQRRHREQKAALLQDMLTLLTDHKQSVFAIWQAHGQLNTARRVSDSRWRLSYKDLVALVEQHITAAHFPYQGLTATDLESICQPLAQEFADHLEVRTAAKENPLPGFLQADSRVLTYDVLAGYPNRPETGHQAQHGDPLFTELHTLSDHLSQLIRSGLLNCPEQQHLNTGLLTALQALRRSSVFDNYLTSRTQERGALASYARRWPFLTLFLDGPGALPVAVDKLVQCATDFCRSEASRAELVAYASGQGATRYGRNEYDYLLPARLSREVATHLSHALRVPAV